MTMIPFIIGLTEQAASGGTISLSYLVPNGQRLLINEAIFDADGIFNLIGIRTSDGQSYGNLSTVNIIKSTMLQDGDNENNHLNLFEEPLIVWGGVTVYFDFIDTSAAANDIWLGLECTKDFNPPNRPTG